MFDRPAADRTTNVARAARGLGWEPRRLHQGDPIGGGRASSVPTLRCCRPGHCVFVLHAADGTPILLADSREAVMADAASQQIETVSLH